MAAQQLPVWLTLFATHSSCLLPARQAAHLGLHLLQPLGAARRVRNHLHEF
jgi:hypothetical protein